MDGAWGIERGDGTVRRPQEPVIHPIRVTEGPGDCSGRIDGVGQRAIRCTGNVEGDDGGLAILGLRGKTQPEREQGK
jgi:hypothetical protein